MCTLYQFPVELFDGRECCDCISTKIKKLSFHCSKYDCANRLAKLNMSNLGLFCFFMFWQNALCRRYWLCLPRKSLFIQVNGIKVSRLKGFEAVPKKTGGVKTAFRDRMDQARTLGRSPWGPLFLPFFLVERTYRQKDGNRADRTPGERRRKVHKHVARRISEKLTCYLSR